MMLIFIVFTNRIIFVTYLLRSIMIRQNLTFKSRLEMAIGKKSEQNYGRIVPTGTILFPFFSQVHHLSNLKYITQL